ncbi:MAG TPA: VOC family protein [Gammaproteobacteria bacterium]|nr:VOC family protein [Gammaproteobacteria bacterium]
MQITNYVFFDGRCAEAFRFYEQLLGGKIKALLRAGDVPGSEAVPAVARERIMHAYLSLGDQGLMGSDWMAERPFEPPQGFYVALSIEDLGEAERVFKALAEGGTVRASFEPTFFAPGFGMLVDRFGVPWMINCAKPN